jgi:IS5 family transposase
MLPVVSDLLQARDLRMKKETVIDATLIAAPSSTKNVEGERDPEMKR